MRLKLRSAARLVLLLSGLWLLPFTACGGGGGQGPKEPGVAKPLAASPNSNYAKQLELAQEKWAKSAYSDALKLYVDAQKAADPAVSQQARLGQARVLIETGRYDEALRAVEGLTHPRAAFLRGLAERAAGRPDQAEQALVPDAERLPEARLLLAEVLLEQGKKEQARPYLMWFAEGYNDGTINDADGALLSMVGRAAHLLGYPKDANRAFNEAERAKAKDAQTLLWRAELFLEKYDPGHAEEVLGELLERAPNHPLGQVLLARVRLDQALNFDAAERLAHDALRHNPRLAPAFATLAGVALRDRELDVAAQWVAKGLEARPGDLELLAMRGATLFLDDDPGFEVVKQQALKQNPASSLFFRVVGKYAEWEHRYGDVVNLMEDALRVDPDDALAKGELGLNLIRRGEQDAGVIMMREAADADPFNVRVFNTLKLYEEIIPRDYVSVERGRFKIRYPKAERELLDRYVPELLERAFSVMQKRYGFTPETPVGVEFYADRASFGIRTGGLPRTAIQGVCFGRTLATLSLANERFNLGMTLWHELAHVFHIQLSKNRVPRWFTEGLAEYETLIAHQEWAREHDLDLYEALRQQRVPAVASMSRAFTHAESMRDMATAYYVSSKIVVMLAERYGIERVVEMLRLWGQGQQIREVSQGALETTPSALDQQFQRFAEQSLARYQGQFVPLQRAPTVQRATKALEEAPNDVERLTVLAKSFIEAGVPEQAMKVIARAHQLSSEDPDTLYLFGRLNLDGQNAPPAKQAATALATQGSDGYLTQLLLAQAELSLGNVNDALGAFERAHHFDPTAREPLDALAHASQRFGDSKAELEWLRKLGPLSEHDGESNARLLQLLVESGEVDGAVALGATAIWTDLSSLELHYWYAKALAKAGRHKQARFEMESAGLCPGTPEQKARVRAARAMLGTPAGAIRFVHNRIVGPPTRH